MTVGDCSTSRFASLRSDDVAIAESRIVMGIVGRFSVQPFLTSAMTVAAAGIAVETAAAEETAGKIAAGVAGEETVAEVLVVD